ncbi:PIN2/TERF1-interacting telomerase inhibitor 1-like [Trifolium pratense]|uniref:PIN2/TERF1-interacting telomerase inhibitor 1-like n=1 Tax=Trifolium pratense TaxID=57577 RepID=UPI001E693F2C|nr:PIN2/TERF1-interacting telomerase inhibitor 1-like [Trifolium pratense]
MKEMLGSASTSTTINSSNIGFQLLKKHGWKEGTGLGIYEQGRLEPLETRVKNNKRGLGADIVKKKVVKPDHGDSSKADNKQEQKKTKALPKRVRKMQELEKKMQEKEFERAFFREFWPENV